MVALEEAAVVQNYSQHLKIIVKRLNLRRLVQLLLLLDHSLASKIEMVDANDDDDCCQRYAGVKHVTVVVAAAAVADDGEVVVAVVVAIVADDFVVMTTMVHTNC